jgi:ATP-dependent Lon protease
VTFNKQEYPQFYHKKPAQDPNRQDAEGEAVLIETDDGIPTTAPLQSRQNETPEEGNHVFAENRKGVSYDKLFGPYIDGATLIVITDPYIQYFYQIKNMMEFVEMVIQRKAPEDQVSIHLVTCPFDGEIQKQRDLLDSITNASSGSGLDFTWAFDTSGTAHARDIVTDTGWKIVLDRGLDIFQPPVRNEGFNLSDRLQEHRMLKGFYVTYVRQLMAHG